VLDGTGRPICCELWPGNLTDVSSLIPVVNRLKSRFGIASVCVVADRGMISAETIEKLESTELGMSYILGARMHRDKTVRDEVLPSSAKFQVVTAAKKKAGDPSPLSVREQWVKGRRYIVCYNDCRVFEREAQKRGQEPRGQQGLPALSEVRGKGALLD
jgi:transposase